LGKAGRPVSISRIALPHERGTAARLSWQKLDLQSGGIVNVYMERRPV